jgi:hypothetical protein
MADNWHVGNATDEAGEHRGWLLGHFMAEPGDPSIRATNALEVKWGIHPAGQERPTWTSGDDRTTMVILVSGRFGVNLPLAKSCWSVKATMQYGDLASTTRGKPRTTQ